MQADGRDDSLVQAVGPAVGLDLVANLNGSIHGIRRRTGEDGPVRKQHRCGTVVPVSGKARVDQVLARGHGRSQGSFIHTATVAVRDSAAIGVVATACVAGSSRVPARSSCRQVVAPEPAGFLDKMQNSLPSGSASVIQPLPSGRR